MKTAVAYGLARRIGLPIVIADPTSRKEPHWDGHMLHVPASWPENVLHEIAHCLIARKYSEADRVDWGLEQKEWRHYLGEPTAEARETEANWLESILEKTVDAAIRELGALRGDAMAQLARGGE